MQQQQKTFQGTIGIGEYSGGATLVGTHCINRRDCTDIITVRAVDNGYNACFSRFQLEIHYRCDQSDDPPWYVPHDQEWLWPVPIEPSVFPHPCPYVACQDRYGLEIRSRNFAHRLDIAALYIYISFDDLELVIIEREDDDENDEYGEYGEPYGDEYGEGEPYDDGDGDEGEGEGEGYGEGEGEPYDDGEPYGEGEGYDADADAIDAVDAAETAEGDTINAVDAAEYHI